MAVRGLERRSPFARVASAGVLFQGGAAAVDAGTIVAALVYALSGSTLAVGAAAAISRMGWLMPQIFVAHLAQGRERRMPFYAFGAFGRATCLLALAVLLWLAGDADDAPIVMLFFVLWTAYAFIAGVIAVPYNDIVARLIPSERRSRLLAVRFFGGGILALGVAAVAHRLLDALPFPQGYGAVFLVGAALLFASAASFVSAGEPAAKSIPAPSSLGAFLRAGLDVLRRDARFRLFLGAQWLSGLAGMALPFYVVQAQSGGAFAAKDVALLVGAQMAGALASNPLWGYWGDHRGKLSLLRLVAVTSAAAPALVLLWLATGGSGRDEVLLWFALVFVVLGAADNGRTIAYLGYLMEISPDERRPAYSGYFNVLVAPVWLFPMVAAGIAEAASLAVVFALSLAAIALQLVVLGRLAAVDR